MSRKKARIDAMRRAGDQRHFHENILRRAISRWRLDDDDRDALERLLHGNPSGRRPLMCNIASRQIAIEAIVDTFLASFGRRNRRNLYFVTLCLDAGFTWEDQPDADVAALKAIARRALRKIGVQGFGAVEVDTLRQLNGERRRRLMFHVHALVRSNRAGLKPRKLERALNGLPSFTNMLGARAVVIKPAGKMRNGARVVRAKDLARIGAYLFQHPQCAKRRVPREKREGWKLISVRKGFEPGMALRLSEVWSHIDIFDATFSVGPIGKELHHRWTRKVNETLDEVQPADDAPTRLEIDALWERVREENGSRHYRRFSIKSNTRLQVNMLI